jgi:hypothetical protein
MARYVLPLLVFSAIAAVLVIWIRGNDADDGGGRRNPDPNAELNGEEQRPPAPNGISGRKETPTLLSRHKWLSELERVLARGDLSKAYHFRSKVTESMDEILADKTLTKNLFNAIMKYAIENRDEKNRKLLLPILRVLTTPEATALIEEEYYRVTDDNERIVLLDAMSVSKHNPEIAAPWAVDMAVHAEDPNHRDLAFQFFKVMNLRADTVTEVAVQIYESSSRPAQRLDALSEISRRAPESEDGRKFIRDRLRNPQEQELTWLLGTIEGWGTEKDAIYLESIAGQFPAMTEALVEQAERIRMHRRQRAADAGKPQLPPKDGTPEDR